MNENRPGGGVALDNRGLATAGFELILIGVADGEDSEKGNRAHKERVTVTMFGGSLTVQYLIICKQGVVGADQNSG